jgi:hypothetical protein
MKYTSACNLIEATTTPEQYNLFMVEFSALLSPYNKKFKTYFLF